MTLKAADDYDNIARRLKEIEAEKLDAVKGEQPATVGEVAINWGAGLLRSKNQACQRT